MINFLRYILAYFTCNMTADQVRDLLTNAENHLTEAEQAQANAASAVHEARVRVDNLPPNTDIPQDIGDRINAIDTRVQTLTAGSVGITNEAGQIAP